MRKQIDIKGLLEGGGERLASLRARSRSRSQALAHVLAALPPKLAQTVSTAGIEHGRLTIGVSGGAWASRLRYLAEMLRQRVGEATGIEIRAVRIKVVQSPGTPGP